MYKYWKAKLSQLTALHLTATSDQHLITSRLYNIMNITVPLNLHYSIQTDHHVVLAEKKKIAHTDTKMYFFDISNINLHELLASI